MVAQNKRKATWKSKILEDKSNNGGNIFWLQIPHARREELFRKENEWLNDVGHNMQHITPNSKKRDYSDIPKGGTKKQKIESISKKTKKA